MPQEYDDHDDHSNMQEIPVSQAMSFDGFEEVKPSGFETSTQRITKKGLRYQDVAMIVKCDQNGLPEIQMELKTEHVKAASTSQNPILFILAIGLANGAFKDYNTVDDIFNVGAPRCNRLILEWADHMLRVPIVGGLTPAGPFRTIQERNLFSKQQKSAAQRSFYNIPTAFDFRGEGLAYYGVYSKANRMKFAGHKACDTFRTYYLAEESVHSFLSPVFEIDQLQVGEETPTAACPKGKTPTANSQEHSAVNQIEKAVVTLDNPESTKTELRELPITSPADDGRFLSVGGTQANQHNDLILMVRRSRSHHQ